MSDREFGNPPSRSRAVSTPRSEANAASRSPTATRSLPPDTVRASSLSARTGTRPDSDASTAGTSRPASRYESGADRRPPAPDLDLAGLGLEGHGPRRKFAHRLGREARRSNRRAPGQHFHFELGAHRDIEVGAGDPHRLATHFDEQPLQDRKGSTRTDGTACSTEDVDEIVPFGADTHRCPFLLYDFFVFKR